MKNKIVALLLGICLIMAYTPVTADTLFTLGYSLGDSTFSLKPSSCAETNDVTITTSSVKISAGASATYGFYLPFNCRSVKITYSGAAGTTAIDTKTNKYSLNLSGEGEYTLNFAEYFGYEPQKFLYEHNPTYTLREYVERSGEREFVITSSGGITIEGIVFEKEKTPASSSDYGVVMPDVSDEVLKTVSTVFIDADAPIIQVNGQRRYVDNNNVNVTPLNYNGTLYLPINTLAKALGYYCEDIPEKGYALLRNDTHEFILLGDSATLKNGFSEKQVQTGESIIYRNGKTWAAVRYFAELSGETVGYKDGLVVIDDKYTVKDVLNETSLKNYAKGIFSPFKAEKKVGKTYYVAQTEAASDDNNGSSLAPFKTLKKAGTVAEPGDTVIIREGVYRETFAPKNDGTEANPITFRAAEGEKVVISASDELGKFVNYKDNIYVSSMPWDLGEGRNQIFINGEAMVEARYPNNPKWRDEGMSDLWPVRGDLYAPVGDNSVIRSDTLLNQEDDYWKGGYYVGLFGYGYSIATAKIKSSTKGELKVSDTSSYWWWEQRETDTWNYGSIVGHLNALDIPKEWVKQDDILYIIFPENLSPEETVVEAKHRQLVIDIADRKYINIEGIDTIGGSVRMNNSEMCMLNGMNMKYITHYTLSNDQRDGFIDKPYNSADPNGAPPRGEVGIFVGGTDNIIVNSSIDHSAAAGIYGVGLYTYIENNVLNDCGYMGSYVSGITFNTMGYDAKDKARGGYAVYNNTVYNCGRSCFNISVSQSASHYYAPYLPMEVAYNDFHDGILASLDTGLVYEYMVNMGLDKQKTLIHHNYVYTTATNKEANPHGLGIYHDNGTYGTYTYNNMIFNTQKDVIYMFPLFQQSMVNTPAYHDMWLNKSITMVKDGVSGLTLSDFPQEQGFFAGASRENFLLNYEKAASGKVGGIYEVKDAVLSDGVVLSGGAAKFTENGQYICFENVDFGDGADIISLVLYGDKYYSEDTIDIIVGNSISDGRKTSAKIQINSPKLNIPDEKEITIGYTTGKNNVYIKAADLRSLKIGALSICGLSAEAQDELLAAKVYGGYFTSYDISQTNGSGNPKAMYNVKGSEHPMVNNTWPGTVIKYEAVEIREDAKGVAIAAGSGEVYSNQPVEIYLNSTDSEPIAKYYVDKTEWSDYSPRYIETDEVIPKGQYDVYLKFPIENNETNKSSNVHYFGFVKASEQIPKEEVCETIYGGSFDEQASIDNSEMPFVSRYVERPYYYTRGLTNTKPETTAVYKNVKLNDKVSKIALHYATETGYDGQTIEIRIDDLKTKPIAQLTTTAEGWENFKTETVELNTPIDAGEHDVYITFGGEEKSNLTCKLHWFKFTE